MYRDSNSPTGAPIPGPMRRAAVAGTWYPGERALAPRGGGLPGRGALRAALPGRLLALISPHAGLRYSGPVAAHGYALLRETRGLTAVLVGPSHRAAFDGVRVSPTARSRRRWGAPRGRGAGAALCAGRACATTRAPTARSTRWRCSCPFLQHLVPRPAHRAAPDGQPGPRGGGRLAGALARVLRGADALLVASSDLSHYHPAPVANAAGRAGRGRRARVRPGGPHVPPGDEPGPRLRRRADGGGHEGGPGAGGRAGHRAALRRQRRRRRARQEPRGRLPVGRAHAASA